MEIEDGQRGGTKSRMGYQNLQRKNFNPQCRVWPPIPSLSRGVYRVGDKYLGITPENFSNQPSKNFRAAAVGKTVTRRLISRIILASVVNASSRRRRGLRNYNLQTKPHCQLLHQRTGHITDSNYFFYKNII